MLQEAGYSREEIKELLDKVLTSASSEFEIITARLEEKKRRIDAFLKMIGFYRTMSAQPDGMFSGLTVSKAIELIEEIGRAYIKLACDEIAEEFGEDAELMEEFDREMMKGIAEYFGKEKNAVIDKMAGDGAWDFIASALKHSAESG